MPQPRSVGTHDGPFHADEVTACALLLLFGRIDRDRIVRTRDLKRLDECEYVCDVGGIFDPKRKRFDHHQADYGGPLSSAGMVLRYLHDEGEMDDDLFDIYRDGLVDGVDRHDIGKAPIIPGTATFSHIISNMLPSEYDADEEVLERAFFQALDFVHGHLYRMRERYLYTLGCREEVGLAMAKGGKALIFDRKVPWLENFFALGGERHPALFVIMPAGEHWKLRAIPPTYKERMGMRQPLPQEWAGLLDAELERVSGIAGAVFCHKSRFISVWESREAALTALEHVLGETYDYDL